MQVICLRSHEAQSPRTIDGHRVYESSHCIPIRLRNDGRMMNCNFITSDILKKLCGDHTTPIKHFRSMIKAKYQGHKPSYYKVWDAKQKAIGKMFGNWEESYQRSQKLSHIPCKDIWSMLLPPIPFHLPTQVYSMQSIIIDNMNGPLLRQPQLSKDTVWVVCLYYAKTHKWHPCRPRITPYNAEVRKVVEVCLIWLPHNLQ